MGIQEGGTKQDTKQGEYPQPVASREGGGGVSTRYKFSNTTERGIVCNSTGAGTGTVTGAGGSTILRSHAAMKSPKRKSKTQSNAAPGKPETKRNS